MKIKKGLYSMLHWNKWISSSFFVVSRKLCSLIYINITETNCLVVTGLLDDSAAEIKKARLVMLNFINHKARISPLGSAWLSFCFFPRWLFHLDRRMKLPIVREDYLVDCFKRQKKLPFDSYLVESIEKTHGVATVKVKGQSAVHESSGLQDSGHILHDGKSIYNTTLNMSDLSTGVNR